ncbi:hypothetical protein MY11210_003248 [Beauveria gryllotalpidicola]
MDPKRGYLDDIPGFGYDSGMQMINEKYLDECQFSFFDLDQIF